jgi:hypothetical protein
MFRELLGVIEGIALYKIISLLLFFAAFCILVIRSFIMDRGTLAHLKRLPLDSNTDTPTTGDGASA